MITIFKKVHIKGIIAISIILLLIISITGVLYVRDVYDNVISYKNKLIRFHVIANSDSSEDQLLKLKIRDKIIEEMSHKFEELKSVEETKKVVKDNLKQMKYIASKEIKNNGKNYDVNVFYGDYNFPTKSYGDFTLPAGEYEAVRVVIGEGEGKNWWCVMFPPLCFVDITHGLTRDRADEELKEVLSNNEYDMIRSAKNEDDIPMKLKFKIVEIFEDTKIKFAKAFVGRK